MRHTLRIAAWACGLSLCFFAANADAQQQMHFRDDKGIAIKSVEVRIRCDKNEEFGYADGGGTFSWKPMPPFPMCVVSAVSAQTELFSAILAIPPSGVVDITYVLTRKSVWVVQIIVVDAKKRAAVPGVQVKFECGSSTFYRSTDGVGLAEIDQFTALFGRKQCVITTEHRLYEPFGTTIAFPNKPTEPVRQEVAITRKINVKTVLVKVIDVDTGKGVQDASVSVTGGFLAGSLGTTGSSGVAEIMVDRAGVFHVEVAHASFFPGTATMSIVPGASEESLTTTVPLTRRRQRGGPVAVTVKGRRLDGTVVALQAARVQVEGGDVNDTGPDGQTTIGLPGYVGDMVKVSATASGYASETKSIAVPRFSSVFIALELTFVLTEQKPEVSGLTLAIEVTSRGDGKAIPGASVALDGHGGAVTDSAGFARFTVSGDSMKDKPYLRAIVTKDGYVEKWSDVYAELLKPSTEERLYSIQMVKQAPISGGNRWDEEESGQRGVWIRRGNSDIWDARWGGVTAEITITISGNQVSGERRKSSDGNDCQYLGALAPDGVTVEGLYTCKRFANSVPWRARISR